MADLWGTSRLLLTTFGLIFSQLFSASATLHVLNNVTWDTAFYTCHQHGEQLYSTSDITSLSDVTAGSYWIGAKVQYSSWMWTDNTPLFSYIGEVNEHPESEQIYQIKYNNQASQYYYKCQQNRTTANVMYVGLQREKCYCFNSRSWNQISHESVQTENKTGCLGNFKENCGTENTMSIYKTDLTVMYVTWLLAGDGVCGYIEQSGNTFVKTDKNCNTQRGFVCDCTGNYNNASCYHHDKTHSWFSANSTCSLTKLNKNNAELIREKISGGVQYWIGLKRYKQIVWFDSFYNETLKINTTQNGCVLLTKFSNSSIIFSIQKCSDVQSAICTNNSSFPTSNLPSSETYKTSPVPSSSERTTSKDDQTDHKSTASEKSEKETTPFTFVTIPSSSEITTSKEDKTDHKSTASEKSERETTPFTSIPLTKSQILNKNEKGQIGVAVGVSVTLILLVAGALVVTVWMKRSHKFCFKIKPESSMTRWMRYVNHQNLSHYDEIKPDTDSHYEFATLTDVTMATKPNSSDYELATDFNAANVQTNNSYNNDTDDDYNILNNSNKVKSSSDVYSQVNKKMKKNKTSGSYIVDNQTSNYSHTESSVEGDYDTTESKPKSMSTHDKTYNHIRDVMEGDYDTTTPKTRFSHDDTYNHIAAVTEDDYNIADMDLRNADYTSDDYSHLDSMRG